MLLEPDRALARARHAGLGSGFYYITQKPEHVRAWILGQACSPDPDPAPFAGHARESPSPQCKAQARLEPALYRPDPALCCT
jgi:hypothetical protein